MLGVIDCGINNLRSVANTLRHIGAEMVIATSPDELQGVDKIILPGVGAFAPGMDSLRQNGFIDFLREQAASGTPILGICLGMQFLLESSEEDGLYEGLGLIPGRCVRFNIAEKVPHMGWNQLHHAETHPLVAGIPTDSSYAYFVHSYHAADVPAAYVVATTDYGYAYPSILAKENVFGAQFHPEKSQTVGMQLLRNFVEM